MKTVCVTGHRPAKLPWGYKKEGPDYDEYIESLACTIADYLENGYDHFITGMALGVDMDFAETVIQFREHYDLDVKLECAIPCPNQTLKWSPAETARYKAILDKADKVTLVNDHYFRACMLVRNDYMVDHSDLVLAIWNGEQSGGTWHTIQYAKAKGKQVDIIKVDRI